MLWQIDSHGGRRRTLRDMIFDNLYDEYLLDSESSSEKYTVNSDEEAVDEEDNNDDNSW